jgi:hypothetical protein
MNIKTEKKMIGFPIIIIILRKRSLYLRLKGKDGTDEKQQQSGKAETSFHLLVFLCRVWRRKEKIEISVSCSVPNKDGPCVLDPSYWIWDASTDWLKSPKPHTHTHMYI